MRCELNSLFNNLKAAIAKDFPGSNLGEYDMFEMANTEGMLEACARAKKELESCVGFGEETTLSIYGNDMIFIGKDLVPISFVCACLESYWDGAVQVVYLGVKWLHENQEGWDPERHARVVIKFV